MHAIVALWHTQFIVQILRECRPNTEERQHCASQQLACYATSAAGASNSPSTMKTSNSFSGVMDMFEKGKVLKICAPMVRYSK